MSLFFDCLKLRPTHTALLFQHKIPDALSTPHLWLHLGPLPPRGAAVFKLRKDRLPELLAQASCLLLRDEPDAHEVCRTVCDLLMGMGPRGMRKYCVQVCDDVLAPSTLRGDELRFVPLLAPKGCSRDFQAYLRALQADPDLLDDYYFTMPECFTAPYKRPEARAALDALLRTVPENP